jgi:uncharacterized protein (DUF111 family)
LGVRGSVMQRWPQQRTESVVDVGGHPVRIKRSADRVKVEHDDAVAAATALGVPLRTVLDQASQAAQRSTG